MNSQIIGLRVAGTIFRIMSLGQLARLLARSEKRFGCTQTTTESSSRQKPILLLHVGRLGAVECLERALPSVPANTG